MNTNPLRARSILDFAGLQAPTPHSMAAGGEGASFVRSTHWAMWHVHALVAHPVLIPSAIVPGVLSPLTSAFGDPGALQHAIAAAAHVALSILQEWQCDRISSYSVVSLKICGH